MNVSQAEPVLIYFRHFLVAEKKVVMEKVSSFVLKKIYFIFGKFGDGQKPLRNVRGFLTFRKHSKWPKPVAKCERVCEM